MHGLRLQQPPRHVRIVSRPWGPDERFGSNSGFVLGVNAWEDGQVLRPGGGISTPNGAIMSKRARKRRSRKGNGANHGRRPNA